ncbi:hypothetical protein QBC44DRAFT_393640 [Cladorrhinum sp. PSN332]|nr:hypothetical protein QBC44DRAFT_393640 [Cladorrhinum sp. PSN332]
MTSSSWKPPVVGSRPVAVLGAGVLGRRIACSFVAGGYNVHIRDPSAEARQAAIRYIDEHKQEYSKNLPANNVTVKPGAYTASEDMATAFKDAWLVVEAVPEKLELSSSFKSSLMLDKVGNSVRRRLICDIHFTMPPEIRTVELMTDGETEEGVLEGLSAVLRGCGMLPATARKESTGFIFNRLWAAIKREIFVIPAEGVSDPAEIDGLFEHMFRASVLPCRLMDQVGLDTVVLIEDNYTAERKLYPTLTADWLRENYISQGRLGLKSGEKGGLYPAATPKKKKNQDIYFLDVGLGGNLDKIENVSKSGKILRLDGVTGKVETLVSGLPAPDGIDISHSAGRMYWKNMGANPSARDGSVMSAKLDGSDVQVLIPWGGVFTPKQAVVVESRQRRYFCDREGMSVHSVGLDGKDHQILVQCTAPTGDVADLSSLPSWCVGITVDEKAQKIYWTQKGCSKSGQGRIFRADLDGSNIELVFDKLPEPIGLEIDAENATLYWTDRGEHPRGNSLNRASVVNGNEAGKPEIIARHFHEAIGLKLDLENKRVLLTDLGGSVYSVDVESGRKDVLWRDNGSYSRITF